jgi:hypothetical protein
MTSAATPASSGVDWLVPPNASSGVGAPLGGSALKSAHSVYSALTRFARAARRICFAVSAR